MELIKNKILIKFKLPEDPAFSTGADQFSVLKAGSSGISINKNVILLHKKSHIKKNSINLKCFRSKNY